MHADELEIDEGLVRRLLRTQFPQWAELPIERVRDEGTDNAIFRLGEKLSVRLPRIRWAAGQAERLHVWLAKLAPHLPIAIPASLAVGAPGEGYPWRWAVHTWLPGEVTCGPVAGVWRDLARLLTALQSVETAGAPAAGRGMPLADRDEITRAAIASCGRTIDAASAHAAWRTALAASDWSGPPVWVHGDLDPRNLVLGAGRLRGVLDFGDAGVGDPAVDVAAAWKVLPPDERESFRHALAVDDATWERARGWVLHQALLIVPYYTIETNPSLFLEGRRWLAEVL